MSSQVGVQVSRPRDKLASALEREMDMDGSDARQIAGIVLAAFDDREELDDREIDSDVRSVFYELEERKLLDFRRETYRNDEGHKRRAFFWTIRWEVVEPEDEGESSDGETEDTVYDELPNNAWTRGSAA